MDQGVFYSVKMVNKLIIIAIAVLVVVFGIFLISNSGASAGNIVKKNPDTQKIILSMKNYNYYPNTIKAKVNQPVRIYLDKSVIGCYRSLIIREFGVSKYLATENDYAEFTPTKKGTFRFSCSMGMGTGILIVE